jgi:hypothetical protein
VTMRSRPGLLAFIAGAVVTAVPLGLFIEKPMNVGLVMASLAMTLIVVGAIVATASRRRWSVRSATSRTLLVAWLVIAALALLNTVTDAVTIQAYGDKVNILRLLEAKVTLPRWLVGFGLLRHVFAAMVDLPPGWLPAKPILMDRFIRMSGVIVMGVATTTMLTRWPGRLSIACSTLIPLWFLFSVGCLEYYPIVAWAVPAYLGWLYVEPTRLTERSPYAVGAVGVALPLLYIGFAPLGLAVVAASLSAKPRNLPKVLGAAAATAIVLVCAFWEGSVAQLWMAARASLLFPDVWTFPRYVGKYEAGSNFFSVSYALSAEHLRDLFYMHLFGGGLLFLPGLVAGTMLLQRVRPWRTLSTNDRGLLILAAGLVGFYLVHTLFFIARLGPREDVELYCPTFLVVAFFAGHVADRLIDLGRWSDRAALVLVAALLGSAAVIVPPLAFGGLPAPSWAIWSDLRPSCSHCDAAAGLASSAPRRRLGGVAPTPSPQRWTDARASSTSSAASSSSCRRARSGRTPSKRRRPCLTSATWTPSRPSC